MLWLCRGERGWGTEAESEQEVPVTGGCGCIATAPAAASLPLPLPTNNGRLCVGAAPDERQHTGPRPREARVVGRLGTPSRHAVEICRGSEWGAAALWSALRLAAFTHLPPPTQDVKWPHVRPVRCSAPRGSLRPWQWPAEMFGFVYFCETEFGLANTPNLLALGRRVRTPSTTLARPVCSIWVGACMHHMIATPACTNLPANLYGQVLGKAAPKRPKTRVFLVFKNHYLSNQ